MAHGLQRHQFFGDELGRIQVVEEALGVFLSEELQPKLPPGKSPSIASKQVAAVEVVVGRLQLHRLSHTVDWMPSLGRQWNFTNVLSPAVLMRRKLCTPKPSMVRRLRGRVRSLMAHITMCMARHQRQ